MNMPSSGDTSGPIAGADASATRDGGSADSPEPGGEASRPRDFVPRTWLMVVMVVYAVEFLALLLLHAFSSSGSTGGTILASILHFVFVPGGVLTWLYSRALRRWSDRPDLLHAAVMASPVLLLVAQALVTWPILLLLFPDPESPDRVLLVAGAVVGAAGVPAWTAGTVAALIRWSRRLPDHDPAATMEE